jgi:hypothetical protein
LEALPDLDGNGTPEVGILSEARDGSGLSLFRVEVAADPIVFPYPPAP